jgi:hypothetical protein
MSSSLFVPLIRSLTSSLVIYEFARPPVGSRQVTMPSLNLFECLGNFLKRLEVYTTIPPTPMMMDLIIKIMVELLSVLALATNKLSRGGSVSAPSDIRYLCSMCHREIREEVVGGKKDKIQAALERLDRLTKDEGLSAVAQTLGVVHYCGYVS